MGGRRRDVTSTHTHERKRKRKARRQKTGRETTQKRVGPSRRNYRKYFTVFLLVVFILFKVEKKKKRGWEPS